MYMSRWISIDSDYYKYFLQNIPPINGELDEVEKERMLVHMKAQLLSDMYSGIDPTQAF